MNIIVTVDENWAIGKRDKTFVQIPGNQRYLQQMTAGKTVVMGRKTMQALPQGIPMYGCENIVLSQNPAFKAKGATVLHSEEELFARLEGVPGEPGVSVGRTEDVYVIGGESIYKMLFDKCDTVYVTMVEKTYDADRYFENLDKHPDWVMTEESDEQTYFDITYYFRKYERRNSR